MSGMRQASSGSGAGRGPADRRLKARYRAERRFRLYGQLAIGFAVVALLVLLGTISIEAVSAFVQYDLELEVQLDAEAIDPSGDRSIDSLRGGNYAAVLRDALRDRFPEVKARREKKELYALLSVGADYALQDYVMAHPDSIGSTRSFNLPLSDDADLYFKGNVDPEVDESDRKLSDDQIRWLRTLEESGSVKGHFNSRFFTAGDSREPELAGIQGAIRGSFFTLIVTLVLSFPVGVAAALYLEAFAPRNRLTDLIEVNINNLAAVPSIVFGLLGLAVFLNVFGMPRSAPLVGGFVLALMTLPTIIIAGRAALQAVPPSILEAALGVGASPTQAVLHHVLPQALPGILTGTIIGMARALGETAPLLMIGMVAFIVDLPDGFSDPSTVLPVQIFLWSEAPERAFVAKTSAAIVVLLAFLVVMNGTAVWVRRRFENRA
jgi:phosphate transport system permease protein